MTVSFSSVTYVVVSVVRRVKKHVYVYPCLWVIFHFNKWQPHLLLYTVSSVHVFDVIEEVTDWVHVVEMLAVLIHRLEHLIEGHTNLKHQYTLKKKKKPKTKKLWSNVCPYLQHASRPLLLETLQKRPHQVIHIK